MIKLSGGCRSLKVANQNLMIRSTAKKKTKTVAAKRTPARAAKKVVPVNRAVKRSATKKTAQVSAPALPQAAGA